jgi:hypothetical protein
MSMLYKPDSKGDTMNEHPTTTTTTCTGCGEHWPCSVARNRSAYRGDIVAMHTPSKEPVPGDGEKAAQVARRCSKHHGRPDLPALCHTCQRIAVEQEIVTRTVDALLAAGYALQTDVQDDPRPAQPTGDRAVILSEMMAVDDEFLGAYSWVAGHGVAKGWVRFVYGNSGWDVVSDYTTNLEAVLAPINEYADTLSA